MSVISTLLKYYRGMHNWINMKRKLLLLFMTLFAQLLTSAQVVLKINSVSKIDNIELRNFFNDRLENRMKSDHEKAFEMEFEKSDSLVIEKRNYIPIALVNLNTSTSQVLILELPSLFEYDATDTIYRYVSRKRMFSKKRKENYFEYFPKNSSKLDSLPQSIEVIINEVSYRGNLNRRRSIGILNADGKKYSMDEVSIGIDAIYVVHFKDE